jgi:hypothetical protein
MFEPPAPRPEGQRTLTVDALVTAHCQEGEMAKFNVSQKVKVVDVNSDHHGEVGTVTVVAPKQDSNFYWLKFGSTASGGRFGEDQLQAAA